METICECGMTIKGTSEKHLSTNLKEHKKSKRHKEIIKNIQKKHIDVRRLK